MKKKSAQAFLSCMFLIFGLLIIISAVGSLEVETISFVKFVWSILIGLGLMGAGCLLADGAGR